MHCSKVFLNHSDFVVHLIGVKSSAAHLEAKNISRFIKIVPFLGLFIFLNIVAAQLKNLYCTLMWHNTLVDKHYGWTSTLNLIVKK